MTEIRDRLKTELAETEYRQAYAQEFLDMTLARQIRALRKQRGWIQAHLAELLNTKQSRVSAMENEEYGALSVASLKDLARVFDVYLNVRFTSFAELLSQVDRTSMEELSVPGYPEDAAMLQTDTIRSRQSGGIQRVRSRRGKREGSGTVTPVRPTAGKTRKV